MPDPSVAVPGRQLWVDRLKGLALVWIFLNHVAEDLWGGLAIGNPCRDWATLEIRFHQLRPLDGAGPWTIPLNLFRYVGLFGDQAVSLFIIASGFVLAWGLLAAKESGPVRWRDFYARRFFRIYPLWWAVHATLVLKFLRGRLDCGEPHQLLLSLLGIRVDGSTFYFYSLSWWYVGLLVQLYLLFPLFWLAMERLGPMRFLLATVVVAAIARGVGMAFFGDYMDPWLRGSVFITRLPEFALGMFLARMFREDPARMDRRLRSPGVIAVSAVLYLLGTAISITWTGMTVAPFLVGLGALGVLYPLLARSPRAGVLGWIGVHSYAVYLVHQKVIDKLLAGHSAVTGGVVLRILAAAALSVVLGVGLEWILARLAKMMRRSPEVKTVAPPAG